MYQPAQEILDKYANVLVNFALRDCQGIEKGDVVLLQVPECAKPMLIALRRAVLRAGGHPIIQFIPDEMSREFFEIASDEQLTFFPDKYMKGKLDQIKHSIYIIADTNKKELEGIDPKKMMARQQSFKSYVEWRDEKENKGAFFWTLGLYGTQAMADEVNLSLEEYWQEIIKACYLDEEDPVAKWKETIAEIDRVKDTLNAMKIQSLHVEAEGTDLTVQLGNDRQWLGGRGKNIPSFEIFISPDWRGTQGKITFTEPLYVYGNLVKDVVLEFKDGLVVSSSASQGQDVLHAMIATEHADKVGEYSLTDGRLSRITKFMGETLYDENVGGKFGNTHLALGKAYQDSFPGDVASVTDEEWASMGYNNSVVHTDIVATSNRTVTATLEDGSTTVIYQDGKFTV